MPSWELPWLGKTSAVARRGVSKTRCASLWQSRCMKEIWNVVQAVLLTGNIWPMTDQGSWWIKGLPYKGLSYTVMQRALSGLNSICHSNRTTLMWSSTVTWRETLRTPCIFLASLSDFPVRDDFSAAWPVLGGLSLLQPQAVHLFLYLPYMTYVSKQSSLGSSLTCICSVSRIDGIYSSLI